MALATYSQDMYLRKIECYHFRFCCQISRHFIPKQGQALRSVQLCWGPLLGACWKESGFGNT